MKRIILGCIAIQMAWLGAVFGEGQLTSAVEIITLEAATGYDNAVYGQKAQANRLVLLPDSVFYSPKGPSVSTWVADTVTPGAVEFNKGNVSTSPISNITRIGQELLWPIMPASTGTLGVEVYIEANVVTAGADLIVRIGDSYSNQFTVVESDGTSPQPWSITNASITAAGVSTSAVQFLTIELANLNGSVHAGNIHQVKLTGTPLNNGYLVRARYRPLANHCRYASSGLYASGLDAKMWVMECRPDFSTPNPYEFYAPLTTAFGYYGSAFYPAPETPENDFTTSRMNFSMWSWGSTETEPPQLEQSHLLSLGNPNDTFGSFTHEGSGVKPRGADMFPDPRTSHVLALRYEPDDLQDSYRYKTYESYYYDNDTTEWKFYASGRKYAGGLSASDNVLKLPGSFVEVPGPLPSERTGHIPRTSDVRGWVQDTSGTWHQIDIISSGDPSTTEPFSKQWDSIGNGWHRMSMGGVIHRLYHSGSISLQNIYSGPLPTYMDPTKLTVLDSEPCLVDVNSVVVQLNGTMNLDFTLTDVDADTEVKLYYGTSDALTLFDEANEWDQFVSLGTFASGNHQLTIPAGGLPGLPDGGYCRILAECSKGRYWSRETSSPFGNNAPAFDSDPISDIAEVGVVYTGTLSAFDLDNDPMTYSKVSGPDWLTVAPNGALSGTPGTNDLGKNRFIVRVTDAFGLMDNATLNIAIPEYVFQSSDTPVSISSDEASTIYSTNSVFGLTREIHDVDVELNIAHTYDWDLVITLIAPDSTEIRLVENRGYSGHNFTGTVLDDAATQSISSGSAPFTGIFSPESPLAVLNGKSANGDWILRIEDTWPTSDGGSLNSWSLRLMVTNQDPIFTENPIAGSDGTEDVVYAGTIAGSATDADAGDILTYSKTAGSAWLNVATNGTLSGIPGAVDFGPNAFTVQVTDGNGGTNSTTLNIEILKIVSLTSVNFATAVTGSTAIDGTESAGFIDTTDWANVTTTGTTTGVGGSLVDVTLINTQYGNIATRGAESSHLFNAGLRSSNGTIGSPAATIANMTAQLAAEGATSYNLYVYFKSHLSGTKTVQLALGQLPPLPSLTTYGAADNDTFSSTGFVLADAGNTSVESNYIVFTGLTDDTITMFVNRGNSDVWFNGFQIEAIGRRANQDPIFTENPIAGSDGAEDVVYAGTIAGSATDVNPSDILTYSKTAGPVWLNVADTGALSGTPPNGYIGTNTFTVQVADGNGGSDSAELNIEVLARSLTSVNFSTGLASDTLDGTESSGVLPTTDWKNVDSSYTTTTTLPGTVIELTLSEAIEANTGGYTDLSNAGLRSSGDKYEYATIGNMTAYLAAVNASSYDLYVYYRSQVSGDNTVDLGLGQLDPLPTFTNYDAAPDGDTDGPFVEAGNPDSNYIKYTGLTADTITMFVDRGSRDALFVGFQIKNEAPSGPDLDGDTLNDAWEIGQYGSIGVYSDTNNPDGDRLNMFAEMAFGGDALVDDSLNDFVTSSITNHTGSNSVAFSYRRAKDYLLFNIDYQLQTAAMLETNVWINSVSVPESIIDDPDGTTEWVNHLLLIPEEERQQFYRCIAFPQESP